MDYSEHMRIVKAYEAELLALRQELSNVRFELDGLKIKNAREEVFVPFTLTTAHTIGILNRFQDGRLSLQKTLEQINDRIADNE